jgi:hypothetical protein
MLLLYEDVRVGATIKVRRTRGEVEDWGSIQMLELRLEKLLRGNGQVSVPIRELGSRYPVKQGVQLMGATNHRTV